MKRQRIILMFAFAAALGLPSCNGDDGQPLLSFLMNNRMVVILKATYASDSPLEFSQINGNQIFRDLSETTDISGIYSYSELPILIDIGEIRLSSKAFMQDLNIIQSAEDSIKFWDTLSSERKIYCNHIYSLDRSNNACVDSGGFFTFRDLMNGTGVVYPSRDVGPATYLHTGVYVRSIVTGHSKADGQTMFTNFDNNKIDNAMSLLHLLNYDPGTGGTATVATPQLLPLHHKVVWGQQSQMNVDDSSIPLVLEIRFNLKENLMAHGFINSAGQSQTVVAVSDWRKPHVNESFMGGNLLMRSRMFYPDFTTNLNISGGTESVRHYYAVYILNECADSTGAIACDLNDQLPLAATPVRNGVNVIKDLPAGSYRLQCRYDAVYDGYPENVLGEVVFNTGVGPAPAAQVACACGHSDTVGCN